MNSSSTTSLSEDDGVTLCVSSSNDSQPCQTNRDHLRRLDRKRHHRARPSFRKPLKVSTYRPAHVKDIHGQKSHKSEGENDTKSIARAVEALLRTSLRQEELLTALTAGLQGEEKNHSNHSTPMNVSSSPATTPTPPAIQMQFDASASAALDSYVELTLHPDSVWLCDLFLARFNLPHILSRLYDPLELIHMHGWEPEDDSDSFLVVRLAGLLDGWQSSRDVEVPWRDQAVESELALELVRAAPAIKFQWSQQGRSLREREDNDDNDSLESDDFADPISLRCPGDTKAILYQSSYDSRGAHTAREAWLCARTPVLTQLQPYDDRLSVERDCPWDGRVFGRIWYVPAHPSLVGSSLSEKQVSHDSCLISFACIHLVLSQMSISGETSQRMQASKMAARFLSCYASRWPRFVPTHQVWLKSDWLQLHFHLRVLSVGKRHLVPELMRRPLCGGLRPARVSGRLASLDGLDDLGVVEQRFALALVTTHATDLPMFTIVYLNDMGYRRLFNESDRNLDTPNRGPLTAVAVFLKVLRSVLIQWERRWHDTLDKMDNLVDVKYDDLFNAKGDGAMFDSTFARSRFYLTILETLRVFAEWIQESGRELKGLKASYDNIVVGNDRARAVASETEPVPAPNAAMNREIEDAWQELLSFYGIASSRLLHRIEKKQEIRSFRDGLFSAISVRETSRARVLNQYILVFTFVTIFYLPLNYVSSLFSMDIFFHDDKSRNEISFFISTVLMAAITWTVAAAVLWVVHDEQRSLTLRMLREKLMCLGLRPFWGWGWRRNAREKKKKLKREDIAFQNI